ncbi:MAG: endolytic transglycosylase MltG [bacterium]
MKRLIIIISVLVLLLVLLSAGLYFYSNERLSESDIKKNDLIITIPHGTSLNHCVEMLNENGLFKPHWFFNIYFRVYSELNNRHINAGSYKFTPEMNNKTILESLFKGKNLNLIKVTYPEGITLDDFASITEKKFGISKYEFLNYINSPEILEKYGIPAKTAEGYLNPNTYIYFFNADLVTVANRLFAEQEKIWLEKFERQAKAISMSKHEVLTLASIIEAETPVISERKKVSGVYHNRLKKNMLLQADPTIAYMLKGKEILTFRDLKINNTYNTYIYPGLPPGPINSPSISSIDAALNPEIHDYLYFVAKGDSSKSHNFAETYSEHIRYVSKYRKNIRKR